MSQNIIFLIGRIGQTPETLTVGSTTVTKFSLATSEKYVDKNTGEVKELTEWHNIEAWGKRGETIGKYHEKGDQIHIVGKLIYDQWEDKEGKKRTTAKVRVTGFSFIKNRPNTKVDLSPVEAGNSEEYEDMPF